MDENGKVSIKLDIHGTPAENLQRLITDCGVSPHKVRMTPCRADDRCKNWSKNSLQNTLQTRSSTGSFPNSITSDIQSTSDHSGLVSLSPVIADESVRGFVSITYHRAREREESAARIYRPGDGCEAGTGGMGRG